MSNFRREVWLTAVTVHLVAFGAWSHHAASMFDFSKTVEITGAVKSWQFMAPHSWLYILTLSPEGKQVLWGFEGGGPSVVIGNLKKDSFKVGDKLTVKGFPMRDGRPAAMLNEVAFSDGRVLKMGGFGPPGTPPVLPR